MSTRGTPASRFPLRDAKALETRRRIFNAATELFSKSGYHATTVSEIAIRAGVAKGTFFVHFPSKGAIVAALVAIQTRSARAARQEALATDGPVAALRAATLRLGERAGENRVLSRGVLAASLESQEVGGDANALFDEVLADMVVDARAAKRAGMLRAEVDPDTLAGSLMAAYLGAVLAFTSRTDPKSLVEMLTPVVELTLAGAVAPRRTSTKTKKKGERS